MKKITGYRVEQINDHWWIVVAEADGQEFQAGAAKTYDEAIDDVIDNLKELDG